MSAASAIARPLIELRIAGACVQEPSALSPDGILARLQEYAPELGLRYGMTRAGWHRLGGVVDAQHRPVARHVAEWAEELSKGDIERLMETCAEIRGFVTRLEGRTHYFTAVTGEWAQDFIQIEVEQVQEVIGRPLWDPARIPEDLQEFVDPLGYPRLDPVPVAPPRLLFRRLLKVSEFLCSEDASRNLKRFLQDWNRSSAGESASFCDHWILSFREYRDTQGDGHLTAKPVALPSDPPPELPAQIVGRGATLANLIHGFDRHRGYHFAWFFHMLTQRRVSHQLAEAVHSDLMGAFDYLPAQDIAVLRDWYDDPYSI